MIFSKLQLNMMPHDQPEVEMTSKWRKRWRRCPFSPDRGPKKHFFSLGCDFNSCVVLILTQLHLNTMVHYKPEVEMTQTWPFFSKRGLITIFFTGGYSKCGLALMFTELQLDMMPHDQRQLEMM